MCAQYLHQPLSNSSTFHLWLDHSIFNFNRVIRAHHAKLCTFLFQFVYLVKSSFIHCASLLAFVSPHTEPVPDGPWSDVSFITWNHMESERVKCKCDEIWTTERNSEFTFARAFLICRRRSSQLDAYGLEFFVFNELATSEASWNVPEQIKLYSDIEHKYYDDLSASARAGELESRCVQVCQ